MYFSIILIAVRSDGGTIGFHRLPEPMAFLMKPFTAIALLLWAVSSGWRKEVRL
jgi:hypothetical protein